MRRGAPLRPPRRGAGNGRTTTPATARAALTPPPRLILFDLDDTLCDYAAARNARLRHAFLGDDARDGLGDRLEAMVADSIECDAHGADHFPELFRRHGIADPDRARQAMAWYRRNRFHGLLLHGDARATLAAVRRYRDPSSGTQRRGVGVITNGPGEVQRTKIALLGLDDLVDFCVVSGEVGFWKPDPRIFVEALRRGGVEAGDAVFVGDSAEHDVAGAQAAGIRSIWVDRTGAGWGVGPPPDRSVRALIDVPPLLASEE